MVAFRWITSLQGYKLRVSSMLKNSNRGGRKAFSQSAILNYLHTVHFASSLRALRFTFF